MGRVKEAIMTVEDMFDEEFEKFEEMLEDALEDFRKNGCNNEDVVAEIQMATCEGKLEAYARVAKELLGDESLEKKYETTVEKYANDVLDILVEKENNEEDEDDNFFDVEEKV